MQIQTTRFGTISITEADLIAFPEGILGFSDLRKFILLDDPNDEIFAWMQSCEKPGIAFPILEPEFFVSNYKVNLTKHELDSLQALKNDSIRFFNIVTIPEDVTQMTANQKAPIAINVRLRIGKQIVAQENDYQIKFPIFMELQKRIVQNPQTEIKSGVTESGVAIRLPAGPSREINV